MEAAATKEGYRYVLGSVLNQVLLHQSIIGLETKTALDKYNVVPDIIIGCAGGGSNLGGLISPFMGEKLRGENGITASSPWSPPPALGNEVVVEHLSNTKGVRQNPGVLHFRRQGQRLVVHLRLEAERLHALLYAGVQIDPLVRLRTIFPCSIRDMSRMSLISSNSWRLE